MGVVYRAAFEEQSLWLCPELDEPGRFVQLFGPGVLLADLQVDPSQAVQPASSLDRTGEQCAAESVRPRGGRYVHSPDIATVPGLFPSASKEPGCTDESPAIERA